MVPKITASIISTLSGNETEKEILYLLLSHSRRGAMEIAKSARTKGTDGMKVIVRDPMRQSSRSTGNGKRKFHPMQCRAPNAIAMGGRTKKSKILVVLSSSESARGE